MRVLVTGHLGYIGTVMVPMLLKLAMRSLASTAIFMRGARSRREVSSPWCRICARMCATPRRTT